MKATNLAVGLVVILIVGGVVLVGTTGIISDGFSSIKINTCSGDIDDDNIPNLDERLSIGSNLQCRCDQDNPKNKDLFDENAHIYAIQKEVFTRGDKPGKVLFDSVEAHGFTKADLEAIENYIKDTSGEAELVLTGPTKEFLKSSTPNIEKAFCPSIDEPQKNSDDCFEEFEQLYFKLSKSNKFIETCYTTEKDCDEQMKEYCG